MVMLTRLLWIQSWRRRRILNRAQLTNDEVAATEAVVRKALFRIHHGWGHPWGHPPARTVHANQSRGSPRAVHYRCAPFFLSDPGYRMAHDK